MPAGYSGTPLVRKLGLKGGMRCVILDPPENYWNLLDGLPDDLTVADPEESRDLDFIHVFASERDDLAGRLETLRGQMAMDGMVWVSWPKKSSGVATDVTREVVRDAGLSAGLVDVKVCAVDETWSGLKFVMRKEDRR